MESPENIGIDILNLGLLLKEKMNFVEHEMLQITGLKVELRELLKENNIKKFDDDNHNLHVKMTQGYAFDHGLFRMKNPELAQRFFSVETITQVKDVYSKSLILKENPKEYKECLIELTARLSIK